MKNDITYEMLWQLTQKEKQSNELQQLPKTFYEEMAEFLHNNATAKDDEDAQNIRKNATRLAEELFEKRKQKIFIYVAYKKPIPQPTMPKEQELYNKLTEIFAKENLDADAPKKSENSFMALQTIPEIILPSGRRIGPLEKDQLVEISAAEEDIKFLLTNTICKRA